MTAPYVPGWDTHGLPIEQKAIKDLGLNRDKVSKAEFREKCKEFALSYVNIQREEFKRLGVIGDWDNPYLTLRPDYEAIQIKAFGEMLRKAIFIKALNLFIGARSVKPHLLRLKLNTKTINLLLFMLNSR